MGTTPINPLGALAPPPAADAAPAPPEAGRLVTPELLFLNQATTYRLGAAFAGTANPSTVWQQMIDSAPISFLYYRELVAKDDDIADAIDEMKLSVQKRGWQNVPGDDSNQALAAKEFIDDQFKGLPDFENNLSNLADALFHGVQISELMFDSSMGQASLMDIVDCPQELFCFNSQNMPQVGPLRLKQSYVNFDGSPVPEQKFLVFSSRMQHGNRMGMPILREIYWSSWFKRNVQRFWMKYGEKGPGTAVVVHKDGADAAERTNALAAAEALIDQTALAVPESFRVVNELLTATRSMDPQTFASLYSVLESKIYRRIVGGTLTSHGSDGGKGTQALGNVHAETKEERSIALCGKIANVINRQLIRNMVLWNFGPACPPPVFGYNTEDEADLGQLITVADTAQQMGKKIPLKWFVQTFGIPEPEGPSDLLERPVAPAAITTPAGTPARPQFSDAQQAQIDREQVELDRVFGELRQSVLDVSKEQIQAVVKSAGQVRG